MRVSHLNGALLDIAVLNSLHDALLLLGHTHIGGESGVWNPLAGIASVGLLKHAVDLLEGETLRFWDEEVGVDEAGSAEGAPDEEDLGAEVTLVRADHVWGDDGDDLQGRVSRV
jgi:hypothetical protein